MNYQEVADLDRLVEFILESVALDGDEQQTISSIKARVLNFGWDEELIQELQKYIESVVPDGDYCYDLEPNSEGSFPKMTSCPFWDKDESKHYQEAGYCHLLQHGDWEFNESKVYINCGTGEKL